ncbi:MAG: NYN domain-containing protein, partial [Candidatus Helarchaeota archaeon]|nr:NYN domain-containing protein [Candidatus Helarchaeota archaeon]
MSQNNSKNEEDNKDDNDIAVVWDFENIRVADHYNLEYLLNNMDFYLQEIGRPVYRKVYDNLSSPKEIWDVFLNHRFDIRHTKRTRKNQLDFYLMSETIDYINKNPKIRTCVLITNDGDFTALVENLQKNSVKVILLHEDKCSIDLLNLVDVHVNIKNIKHKILQSIIKELILEKNVISLLLNKQEFKEIIYNMKDIIRYLINFYHIRSKLIFKEIFD